MQSPILPVRHSDLQWALYASTAQPIKSQPVTESAPAQSTTPLLVNVVIILFLLSMLAGIVYKKRRADGRHQRIRRLEKLWQLESHSPFEERQ